MQEVSDEVRRDKLFGFFRRYAWIGIVLVLLLVSAAGVNEYRKSQLKLDAELTLKIESVIPGPVQTPFCPKTTDDKE